jgi:hypothetical protein
LNGHSNQEGRTESNFSSARTGKEQRQLYGKSQNSRTGLGGGVRERESYVESNFSSAPLAMNSEEDLHPMADGSVGAVRTPSKPPCES